MEHRDDSELVQRTQEAMAGDLRAFETLVGRHQAKVLANCRYLSGSHTDAQDLAQEVFIKAYFGLRRFEKRASFGSWIKRIKVNHCLNHLRAKRKRTFVDLDDPATEAQPELQVDAEVERRMEAMGEQERVREVLDALPETLRLPLIMRDLDEMPYQEIADSLAVGLSAVKMRIKRGRAEFRRLYGDRVVEI